MINRQSPISCGEPSKVDRPIAHRVIRSGPLGAVTDLTVTSDNAKINSTTKDTFKNYLKELNDRKRGLKKAWDNSVDQANHSTEGQSNTIAGTIANKFIFPSTANHKSNQNLAPQRNFKSTKAKESETSFKRFSTPLLDMPTPTRSELAELESDINAAPYRRIQRWRSDTAKDDLIEPVRWELKHWHLLEYWYGIYDNNVDEASRAFYEHEAIIDKRDDGSESIPRHKWSLEDIRRRCQCLDTNIRYNNGISPRKKRRRSSVSSNESHSSIASSLASIAGQAINRIANRLIPKRQRVSRAISNASFDDASSAASMNSSFRRLWTDDKARLTNNRILTIEELQQRHKDTKINLPITTSDERASSSDYRRVSDDHKLRLPLKEITPERELTPPLHFRKPAGQFETSESFSRIRTPTRHRQVGSDNVFPTINNRTDNNEPLWRQSSYTEVKGTKTLVNESVNQEEGEDIDDEPSKYAVSDSKTRVKVNWREDPAATPKRGRVRQLLEQLESGLPLDETVPEKKIPFYASSSTSSSL